MDVPKTRPYFMRDPTRRPKDENRQVPNVDCPMTELSKINVEYYKLNESTWETQLEKYAKMNEMHARDEVVISRVRMGSQFDIKMKEFFTEHLHEDAEVRFIKEGSGYFDFRSTNDKWIRVHVTAMDLLYLPAGIYHRFTTDNKDYAVAIRLFKDMPRWEAIKRSSISDGLDIRKNYLLESGIVHKQQD